MKKIIWMTLMVSLIVTACSAGTQPSAPTPLPEEVDWSTAVNLLRTGKVDQVFQLHNLTVTLYFKDGQQVRTVEPVIDAIFAEVETCGNPCSNILLATE